MRINDDLKTPVLINTEELPWIPSPAAGVDRRMLFRIGEEVARATSIVRYAAESAFPRHSHGGGEEIVVLDGVFQDEHGDYPAGSYFRNPPGTSHVPASKDGCTIFVRLWQFRHGDRNQIVLRPDQGRVTEVRWGADKVIDLFSDSREAISFAEWSPGRKIDVANLRGIEALVVEGSLSINDVVLQKQGWMRLPAGDDLQGISGREGVKLWLRDASLIHADVCVMA